MHSSFTAQSSFNHWPQTELVMQYEVGVEDELDGPQVRLDPRNDSLTSIGDESPVVPGSADEVSTQTHVEEQQPGEDGLDHALWN